MDLRQCVSFQGVGICESCPQWHKMCEDFVTGNCFYVTSAPPALSLARDSTQALASGVRMPSFETSVFVVGKLYCCWVDGTFDLDIVDEVQASATLGGVAEKKKKGNKIWLS